MMNLDDLSSHLGMDHLPLNAAVGLFLPLAIAVAAVLALHGVYLHRRRLGERPHRSEESRSPPRGRVRASKHVAEGDRGSDGDERAAILVNMGEKNVRGRPERKMDFNEAARSFFPTVEELRFPSMSDAEMRQMEEDRRLYYKLQNLEIHPDALDLARTRLLQLFDHTLDSALSSPAGTILALEHPAQLEPYFAANHTEAATKYKAYIARRRAGGPRELFPSREYAIEWLRLAAPVKYVDGVWIADIFNIGLKSFADPSSRELSAPSRIHERESVLAENTGFTKLNSGRSHSSMPERQAAKLAWQVIAEEFGDGDLEKNHVYVYHELLKSLSPAKDSPAGDSLEVAGLAALLGTNHVNTLDPHPKPCPPGLNPDSHFSGSPRCWTAAVTQQCIGLLAHEFFPEALGFNMAYETLPYHLLVTSYELRQLGIDDYYFALHVTIDNPDSGHAAMGRIAVERYLKMVEERDGTDQMERMWKRIKAGVTLADGVPTTPMAPREFGYDVKEKIWRPVDLLACPAFTANIPATTAAAVTSATPPSVLESQMVSLLGRKSPAAEGLHCPSRAQIKGQTIEEWLNPVLWTPQRGLRFVRALAETRPWIVKGDVEKSRLVRELQWGGRMFGAFTEREVGVVRRWVKWLDEPVSNLADTLSAGQHLGGIYERFCDRRIPEAEQKIHMGPFETEAINLLPRVRNISNDRTPCLLPSSQLPPFGTLAPHLQAALLLTSTSLLELFPLTPSKFATPLGSTVLRILRSIAGLTALHLREHICAGTDQPDPTTHTQETATVEEDSSSDGAESTLFSSNDEEDAFRSYRGLWEIAETHFRVSRGYVLPESLAELARAVDHDQTPAGEAVATICANWLQGRSTPYVAQAILLGWTIATMGLWTSITITENPADGHIVRRVQAEVTAAIEEYLACGGLDERWRGEFEEARTDALKYLSLKSFC